MARLQAMILGCLPEDPCVSRLLSTGAETRVYCCIRNRTSSELTEDRALLAGALLAKGGAVKLTRTMSNARISEQILTRLLCKRMGAALVGNTRLGTIDLGDNPQLQVRAARILSAACSAAPVSAALVSVDSFCGRIDRPTDP